MSQVVKPGELRFAFPSSLGRDMDGRIARLRRYLHQQLDRETQVVMPPTYEHLARELLSGRVDAAWAPPFVCARVEAMGVRVLVRGVRKGHSTYRGALVCRTDSALQLDTLTGTTAAWSDRDSVGGYLLPMALLRQRGLTPATLFSKQLFLGNYRRALEAVHTEEADVTSIFATAAGESTGLDEVWPEQRESFRVLALTDEAPNDGVAVSMSAPAVLVSALEKVLLAMHETAEGASVLADCFRAERFEAAPRMGYRALYRVALASV